MKLKFNLFSDFKLLLKDLQYNAVYMVKDFREHPDRLTDMLPWYMLLTESKQERIPQGIVLNKDGSMQKTFEYRGPDLNSASKEEVDIMSLRLNNCFKRLGEGWTIYAEAQRKQATAYPEAHFPDPVSFLIDEERRIFFERGDHYESSMYMTLCYLPPPDKLKKISNFFIHRPKSVTKKKGYTINRYDAARDFLDGFSQFFELFKETMYFARELSDDETLTYLHSTISPYQHPVVKPPQAIYLDRYISDASLSAGFDLYLDDKAVAVLTVQEFPMMSYPGVFDQLNDLSFEYRWVTRYIVLDKDHAQQITKKVEKEMFKGRQSGVDYFLQQYNTNATARLDNNAVKQADSASDAHDMIASNQAGFGYFTSSICIIDDDTDRLELRVNAVRKIINNLGYVVREENTNAAMAWFGTIPSIPYANVIKPLLSTENLSDLFPFSSIWSGSKKNEYYNVPPLLYTKAGSTPWRLNLHKTGTDVGHTFILGPTGTGKSILLNLIVAQFRKYHDAQIVIFDVDASSRVLTYSMGGKFYDLAVNDSDMAFPVFAGIDDIDEKAWATEWIKFYLNEQGVELDADRNKRIDDAMTALASSSRDFRNITGFSAYVQDLEIRKALRPLRVGDGIYGQLFDAREEKINDNPMQAFEMGKLMKTDALLPALKYLFHYVDKIFKVKKLSDEEERNLSNEEKKEKSRLKLLIMDESWKFIEHPVFAPQIVEWIKTLRKFNVSVVFATQDAVDLFSKKDGKDGAQSIGHIIINNCPTRIYLPNAGALQERTYKMYESFDLSKKQINIIAAATPRKEYYYQCGKDSRLFELALNQFSLAFMATSNEADQRTAVRLYKKVKGDPIAFSKEWLLYKNLTYEYEAFCEAAEDFTNKNKKK